MKFCIFFLMLWCSLTGTAIAATVELVVPNPPGGAIDNFARQVQLYLQTQTNHDIIVVNRPGADGRVAVRYTLESSPRIKLLVFSTGVTFSKILHNDADFEYHDFEIVAPMAMTAATLSVKKELPVRDLEDFRIYARTHRVNCGSSNAASQLVAAYFLEKIGAIDAAVIAYKGSAALNLDLLGGSIDCAFDTYTAHHPLIQDGSIRLLASGSDLNSKNLPMLSNLVPGLTFFNWTGIAAPKNQANREIYRQLLATLQNLHEHSHARNSLAAMHMTLLSPWPRGNDFVLEQYQNFLRMRNQLQP